jgi:NAD-dependent dihydropyrimidine dehydrogenase PreA subunit
MFLQTAFAKNELRIIPVLDATTRIFSKLRAWPVLWVLSRVIGRFLSTAEVVTVEQATAFIDAISSEGKAEIALGPCRCQQALGKRDGTYMKDMLVLFGAEAYKKSSDECKDITPEEAKGLLREFHKEGLMQTFFACMRSQGWLYAICNCESKICFPFRAHKAAGAVFHPGPDIVALDGNKCTSCGICVDRCHFGANSVNGTSRLDPAKCYGCGVCVSTCSAGARQMVKREGYRNRYFPVDLVSGAATN